MKKLISLLLILTLIGTSVFTLSSCAEEEENLSAKIEEKVIAYQTDLEDSAETLTTTEAIRDYLLSWAKAKGISCTTDGYDNVIMSVKSSEEYEEAAPTVVLCPYDCEQFQASIPPMASALYLIKNNEATGKLTVIFTSESGHDFRGIQKLNSKYFTADTNVFCLNGGSNNMWSVSTGARSTYQFTNRVTYTAPTKDKAYRIKIEGLPGGVPDQKITSYPNAIKELGDLLAYFKTNALIYELADVTGGENANTYPKSASATVVIDENDFDKFDARMQTAIDNFNDDYLENYPQVSYTYEEVDLPEQVMTEDSLNTTITLLYTLIDGIYYKDDDKNLVSISSIGAIEKKANTYIISAEANSLTEASLLEIDNQYQIICGLSDVKYKKVSSQEGWQSDPESEFVQQVIQAFRDYSGKEMELKDSVSATNASYVYEKNPDCNIINVALNEERLERYTGTILTFLLNQEHTEIKE